MKPQYISVRYPAPSDPRLYLLGSAAVLAAGIVISVTGAESVSFWIRVAFGLLVFVLPGGYAFALMPARTDWDFIDFIAYGFAFSVALITVLGLIARTFALHIDAVEFIWYTISIVGYAAVYYRFRALPSLKTQVGAPSAILLMIVISLVALYAHASIRATPFLQDQYRHQAAINGFLRDEPLGWSEPYFETGHNIADRMYFTYWVLAQALIVEIGGAPILLTRFLIGPFVILVSSAGMYVFARNLGHSRKSSGVYVCLGLFALSLVAAADPQAGVRFIARTQLDKVVAAFALAPVAISSAFLSLRSRQGRAYLGYALALTAVVSVHALIGGFAVGIVGIWCMIKYVTEVDERKHVLQVGLITLILFTPIILVRLTTVDSTIYNFDSVEEDIVKKMVVFDAVNPLNNGEKFYAISPIAAGALTYILVPMVFLAVAVRRLDARSKMMLAYAIAVSIGLLPFTAWIYGRLVSFNHVMRILWLMPYGYILGYVVETGWKLLKERQPNVSQCISNSVSGRLLMSLSLLLLPATLFSLQFQGRTNITRDIALAPDRDAELLDIATYIDSQHDKRVWIAASDKYRERILAMHWKVVSLSRYTPERMSYYSGLPLESMRSQTDDNLRLYKADVPLAEKLAVIDRYGIDYLLFDKRYAWIVDGLYQADKERFELVYSGETLRLVRVH